MTTRLHVASTSLARPEATRIKARAVRRSGELLRQIEEAKNQHDAAARAGGGAPTRTDAARNAGLSAHQQKQAVRVAAIPDAERLNPGGAPANIGPPPSPDRRPSFLMCPQLEGRRPCSDWHASVMNRADRDLILDRLDRIEAMLAALSPSSVPVAVPVPAPASALDLVAEATAGDWFLSSELWREAGGTVLEAALRGEGVTTVHGLGRWLAARADDGVERGGVEREGTLWRVCGFAGRNRSETA